MRRAEGVADLRGWQQQFFACAWHFSLAHLNTLRGQAAIAANAAAQPAAPAAAPAPADGDGGAADAFGAAARARAALRLPGAV